LPFYFNLKNQNKDTDYFFLNYAMGANTAGQLGSVVAGGVLLALVSQLLI
jgi:Na+-transporting methylmalonyl-CoA/oxaloacetate decarboxylase beta subunit